MSGWTDALMLTTGVYLIIGGGFVAVVRPADWTTDMLLLLFWPAHVIKALTEKQE